MGWWRRGSSEGTHNHKQAVQAGILLCTCAGLEFEWATAVHLARVIEHGRWHEVNSETERRLKQLKGEFLTELADTILG